jgi:hypothetical protein
MRVVVAKVLAAAANAVLVAQHLLKLGAHLTTALARLQVHNLARKSSSEVGSTREKKGAEEGKCKKLLVVDWTGNMEMQVACAHVSPTRKLSCFSDLSSIELLVGTVQSTRGVSGRGRETFSSATCSLQLAKASAATLLQPEVNDSTDVQRGRANISGFFGAKALHH